MLDPYEFGRKLLSSNDLDPVYVVLLESGWDTPTLIRFLLAYFCFYHAGTATWVLSQIEGLGRRSERFYWVGMETAAGSKDYPRCHERRHFRGENARKSVAYLKSREIDSLFAPLLGGRKSLKEVMDSVREWVGFGKWIAFKVADMLERLGLCDVEFDTGAMFLFKSPQEGAELLWRTERPLGVSLDDAGRWAVERILTNLHGYQAPPRYERGINVQEAETILCKWKSYRGGHYKLGEDIIGLRMGLELFTRSGYARDLLRSGEMVKLWSLG